MPSINIRWSDNTAELRAHLKEGIGAIEAMKSAVDKTVRSLGGEGLFQAAHNATAAIMEFGGATKLTSGEIQRYLPLLDKAIEKARVMGESTGKIPPQMKQLAEEMRKLTPPTDSATKSVGILSSTFGTLVSAFSAASLVNRAVGALTDIGHQAIETASTLVDLSNKTGLSTETLQRMQFVAKQSGSDMGAFADAAFKMGVNVSEGTKKARDGAQALGISWTALRAASPDAQFQMVVEALERMEDPQKRNAAAVDLFGKTAKEVLAGIVDGYTKVASQATVAGDAQVRAVDRTSEAWDRFKERTKNAAINAVGSVLLVREAIEQLNDDQKQFILDTDQSLGAIDVIMAKLGLALPAFSAAMVKAAQVMNRKDIELPGPSSAKGTGSFVADLKAAEAGYRALTAAQKTELTTALQLGKSNDDIINGLNITDDVLSVAKKAFEDQKQAIAKNVSEAAKLAAAIHDLNSVGTDWHQTLAGMDAGMVSAAAAYLKAGVSASAVGTAFRMTEAQVGALAEKLKAETQFAKDTAKIHNELEAGVWGLRTALDGANDSEKRFLETQEKLRVSLKMIEQSIPAARAGFENLGMAGLEGVGLKSTDPEEAGRLAAKMGVKFTTSLGETFQKIPDLLVASFTGGGGKLGAAKAFGTMLGGDVGSSLFGSLKDGKIVGGMFKGMTGLFANLIPAIGPAIGALVGPLIDKLAKLLNHDGADIMHHVGGGWGVKISDGLRDAIVKDMKGKGLSEVAATMIHMGDIIKEAGGLNAGNLDTFTAKLHDTFSMIETHQLTIAQGTKVLDENWATFAAAGTDATGRISDGLKEIIRLDQQFGTQSTQISAFLKQQGSDALDAFNDIVAAADDAAAGYDAVKKSVDEASKDIASGFTKAISGMGVAQRAELAKAMSGFKGTAEEFLSLQAALPTGKDFGFVAESIRQAVKDAVATGGVFTQAIQRMSDAERMALTEGMAGFKGTAEQFLAQQAALYTQTEKGLYVFNSANEKVKTWLSGQTLETINASQEGRALVEALKAQQAAAEAARQELSDLGIQAVASFSAAVASGMSVTDALMKIHPALATLEKDYEDLGLSVDDVALAALMMQDKVLTSNPKLSKGIAGLSKEMIALGNMGLLNAKTFAAMERTGTQMYTRLQGEVHNVGGETKDALLPMQDYLHEAEKAAKDLGVALDPFDQMLIDQSKELGIWRDKGKSAMDTLIDKVTDLINTLMGVPHTIDINGKVTWDYGTPPTQPTPSNTTQPATPPWNPYGSEGEAHTGGLVTALGIQHFGTGGMVLPRLPSFSTGLTGGVPIMAHQNEWVFTEAQTGNLARELEAAVAMAANLRAGAASGPSVILQETITFNPQITTLDPRGTQEVMEKTLMPAFMLEMEDRRRGYAGRLRKALKDGQ